MAFKLEVTFDVPVRIVGEPGNSPIKNHITFVCTPWTTGEGASIDLTLPQHFISIDGEPTFKSSFTIFEGTNQEETFNQILKRFLLLIKMNLKEIIGKEIGEIQKILKEIQIGKKESFKLEGFLKL